MEKMDYIGIDVSNLTLDICHLEGPTKETFKISNTIHSIEQWIEKLPCTAHCVFEATGIYSHKLEYLLGQKGMGCTKLNPNKIKGLMLATGGLHKNDQHDEPLIQRYA